MRFILVSFFISLSILSAAQSNIDVLHYRFEIYLSDNNDSISGSSQIRFKANKELDEVSFDLSDVNKDGKGMTILKIISSLIARGSIGGKHENNKLTIKLPKTLQKGDSSYIGIAYKGVPADGLIISKNKYGHRTFFADNWPNRGHNWIPCHDDPADKASVEFLITAPEHYQVVANGIQIEEINLAGNKKLTHWKEDVPISTKVMVIGVAKFAVNLSGYINDCIPLYSWVYPEDKEKGFYDFALSKEILSFFIKTIGPYGYKKLASVQSKTRFGGLENANTIFYSEESVTGDRREEELYAHEIAHQWFGNMATEKSFGHLWLSEGFATYFTILYMEEKYGKEKAIAMRKEDRDQVIEHSKNNLKAVVDTAETDFMRLLNPYSYQKGGWVLHMLRSQLGDSIFFKTIKKYYATYAGGIAGTDDLRTIFESVSGGDLKQFFHQWLYRPGHPNLKINWKYNGKAKAIDINITQKQAGIFNFPLTVGIKLSSGKILKQTMQINKMNSVFSYPVKEKPTVLIADPDTNLLFEYKLE